MFLISLFTLVFIKLMRVDVAKLRSELFSLEGRHQKAKEQLEIKHKAEREKLQEWTERVNQTVSKYERYEKDLKYKNYPKYKNYKKEYQRNYL